MIVDGALYPLHPLERYTDARDGSYWLTPTTMDHLPVREGEALENALYRGDKGKKSKRKVSGRLNEQVAYPQMWPTPTVQDSKNNGSASQMNRKSPPLNATVKLYPTPDASPRGARKNQNGHTINLQDVIGSGKLNPQWVAWLMGYPIGWISLSPLETQSCPSKLAKLLKS